MHLIAAIHRKNFTRNSVVHVTKHLSDKSSCEVEIEKQLYF